MQTRQYNNPRPEIQSSLYVDYYDRLFEYAKQGDVDNLINLKKEISANRLTYKIGSHPEGGLQSLLVCVKDEEGKTPWDYVIANQHQAVLNACYDHYKNSHIANEYTKFYTAFWFNQIDIVRELLTANPALLKFPKINVEEWHMAGTLLNDDEKFPSLMQAAVLLNSPGMIKLLRGFNISYELKHGKRALIYLAIDKGFEQLACLLAEDTNNITNHSMHPLSYTCVHGHFELLTKLYQKSKAQYQADDLLIVINLLVNLQQKELASYFQQEYEKKKLKYSATVHHRIECEKYTAFYDRLFECAKQDDVDGLLKLSDHVVQNRFAYQLGIFPEYLLHSLLICVRDTNGKTPWDHIVQLRNQKILDELYKDYQRPTYDEWTQFIGAVLYNQVAKVQEALVKHPEYQKMLMDITIFTPLDKAAWEKQLSPIQLAIHNNYPEMIIALRKLGASIELNDEQKQLGAPPYIALAKQNGFDEVVEALLKDIVSRENFIVYDQNNKFTPTLYTWNEATEASQPEPEEVPICTII